MLETLERVRNSPGKEHSNHLSSTVYYEDTGISQKRSEGIFEPCRQKEVTRGKVRQIRRVREHNNFFLLQKLLYNRRKRQCIVKPTMRFKKVMYAIFFLTQGTAIQIAVPKGESVKCKVLQD